MELKRSELVKQLEAVMPGLSANEKGAEQSTHFVFKDGKVITFNDELACVGDCSLGEIEGAVVAAPLVALLKSLKEETVQVELADGELLVKGKGRKAGVRLAQKVTLPFDSVEKPGKWKKLKEGFWSTVDMARQCITTDESQFALTCVHLASGYVEASDGFQLIRCPLEGERSGVLLRGKALAQLVKAGVDRASEGTDWMHFGNDAGLVLSCRRYVQHYIELEKYLDVEGKEATLPADIGDAVRKAEIFSKSDDLDVNLLQVELRQGKVKILGSGEYGWYSEVTKTDYVGEPIAFTIAPKLLVEVARKGGRCVIGKGKIMVKTEKFTFVTCTGDVVDNSGT